MRKSLRIRKIYTVSDEQLLLDITYHLFTDDDDMFGPQVWCGKNVNYRSKHDEYAMTIPEVNCYYCLDIVVALGKECADRLTELPPRVS